MNPEARPGWPRRPHRALLSVQRRAKRADCRVDEFNWAELEADWLASGIDPGACVYCLAPAACIDHIVPLRRGGPHSIRNLVPACIGCNHAKGGLLVGQWLQISRRHRQVFHPQLLLTTIRSFVIRDELRTEGRIETHGDPLELQVPIPKRHRPIERLEQWEEKNRRTGPGGA